MPPVFCLDVESPRRSGSMPGFGGTPPASSETILGRWCPYECSPVRSTKLLEAVYGDDAAVIKSLECGSPRNGCATGDFGLSNPKRPLEALDA